MPIPEMIGSTHQEQVIAPSRHRQQLGRGLHPHFAAMLILKSFATAQNRTAVDLHTDLFPGGQDRPKPAFLSRLEWQGQHRKIPVLSADRASRTEDAHQNRK